MRRLCFTSCLPLGSPQWGPGWLILDQVNKALTRSNWIQHLMLLTLWIIFSLSCGWGWVQVLRIGQRRSVLLCPVYSWKLNPCRYYCCRVGETRRYFPDLKNLTLQGVHKLTFPFQLPEEKETSWQIFVWLVFCQTQVLKFVRSSFHCCHLTI